MLMRRSSFIQTLFFILLWCTAVTGGCAYPMATAEKISPPPQTNTQEVLIREARVESDLLRSELAAVKIAAAKQQAEMQAAFERAEKLQEREESIAANIQEMKANLLSTENERDRLRQENAKLQAQSASLPNLQTLITNVQMIQDSVQQMMANMKNLMAEVTYIKKDMNRSQRKVHGQTANLTAFSMAPASKSVKGDGTWTVKSGDTLWQISQLHGISVNTLMDMNSLESDLIVEGQTLRVPVLEAHKLDTKVNDTLIQKPESISQAQ